MKNKLITNILKYLNEIESYELPESHGSSILHLDRNENYFINNEVLTKIALDALNEIDIRSYPDEEFSELLETLSKLFNIDEEYFVIGFGSDQLIDILTAIFARKNIVVSISPTFSWYRLRTIFHEGTYIDVPLNNDFSLNLHEIIQKSRNASLLFLCSPNNPTGNQFPLDDIKSIVEEVKSLVVIDEAYVDFANFSVYDLVKKYENLIVLRTFSKAYGLAGLRLGYMIASPEIAKPIFKVAQYPYPIANFSAKVAVKLLQNKHIIESAINELKSERERLYNELLKIGINVYKSDANFLLFNSPLNPELLDSILIKNNIKIKRIKNVLGQSSFFRITVGLRYMNDRFLEVIRSVV
jgi:histidinol-phosphate aminotransferase